MKFYRQESWSGQPCPSPGDLPNPGIKLMSPALQVGSLPSEPPGKPWECSNYHTIVLISHANKVMLKVLQARLQQYMNWEIPDVKAELRKGRGTRDQIVNIHWIIKKSKSIPEKHLLCFSDYEKAFDCVDHNELWKILKQMGIPDHLSCLLRNLYAGKEETVRTGHGKIDWLQVEKEVCQGYILSPSLFNLHAAHIMRNARLDESQAGIKISRININNFSPRSCKKLNMT